MSLVSNAAELFQGERLAGIRILLVEDDTDSRELLHDLLSAMGAEVEAASGGREAFAIFQRTRPDLLISDIWMPDGDGYELIQNIRALTIDDGRLTPAIAISAGENQQKAILAGFHAFLGKPLDPMKLIEVAEDFGRTEGGVAQARWTVTIPREDVMLLTLAGFIRPADIQAIIPVVIEHLERRSFHVIEDLRMLQGLSPSVPSMAEHLLWGHRDKFERLYVIGGSTVLRLLTMGAAKILGIDVKMCELAPDRDPLEVLL